MRIEATSLHYENTHISVKINFKKNIIYIKKAYFAFLKIENHETQTHTQTHTHSSFQTELRRI